MLSWRVQLCAAATAIAALVGAGMPAAAADANTRKVALTRRWYAAANQPSSEGKGTAPMLSDLTAKAILS